MLSKPDKLSLRMHFELDGYVKSTSKLLPELVTLLCREFQLIKAGTYNTNLQAPISDWRPGDVVKPVIKIEMPQFFSRSVLSVLPLDSIGGEAANLMNTSAVQIFWISYIEKPGLSDRAHVEGGNIGWHRDWAYWRNFWQDDSDLIVCWIALDDCSERNGTMRLLRGSHNWPGNMDLSFKQQDLSDSQIVMPSNSTWSEFPSNLLSGEMAFHDSKTLHCSPANDSTQPRRALALCLRSERSVPWNNKRMGFAKYIDDETLCPFIFRSQ